MAKLKLNLVRFADVFDLKGLTDAFRIRPTIGINGSIGIDQVRAITALYNQSHGTHCK